MRTVKINVKGGSQSQWSTLMLELNIMKKAWKRYGVEIELKTPNIEKIIKLGTASVEKLKYDQHFISNKKINIKEKIFLNNVYNNITRRFI